VTPILNVSNLEESFEWFGKLGWEKRWQYGDPPAFGAVGNGTYEIFLCNNCQGGRDRNSRAHPDNWTTGGVWMSLWVAARAMVDAVHAAAVREGLLVTCPPTDMPWNVRECHIQHPDGHVFRASCTTGPG
jgi:predicted lactoylglutathione lyase